MTDGTDVLSHPLDGVSLALHEAEYRRLFERSPQPMWVVSATGAFLAVNDAALARFGHGRDAFLRLTLADLGGAADAPIAGADGVAPGSDGDDATRIMHLGRDGSRVAARVRSRAVTFAGEPARLDALMDIGERDGERDGERGTALAGGDAGRETLHVRNAYLAAVHDLTLDLINRLDLAELLEAVVLRATQLVGTAHGFMYWQPEADAKTATVVGIGAFMPHVNAHAQREKDLTQKVWHTQQPHIENDYREWPDGSPMGDDDPPMSAVGVPIAANGEIAGVLTLAYAEAGRRFTDGEVDILSRFAEVAGIALDNAQLYGRVQGELRERRRAEERLRYNATHDPLTDLPNRTQFLERLDAAVRRAREETGYHFAVLFLDLDRFKNVNDSLGHLAGDYLLVSIARRLETCVRPHDLIGRFGGDEFAVLMEDVETEEQIREVAECMLRELPVPVTLWGHNVFTTGTIGIATSAMGYADATDVLRDADTAMYRAKASGGATFTIFDADMRVRAVTRLRMESDLRNALEHGEFRVFYQPIVSLADGAITGFEALVRWQHPQRGLLAPAEFLPVAEETGFIVFMDQWMLRVACTQMRHWQGRDEAARNLRLNVNLSGKHFAQAGLLEEIRALLHETGIAPHTLKLEITEGVLVENTEIAASLITALRELGVQVDVDDFGTGYSSLRYLQRLPIDALKIDRSFVAALTEGAEGEQAIVQMILTLARALHLTVTAEGIETEEQQAILRDLACEYGQGYLYSKPLTEEDAGALLLGVDMPHAPYALDVPHDS